MKTGTMTPSEFVSGAGMARLRREKSAEHLKKRAKEVRATFYKRISELAYLRMALLIPWWREKFPTRRLDVSFDYGVVNVKIDGRGYHHGVSHGLFYGELRARVAFGRLVRVPVTCFDQLHHALDDVDAITHRLQNGVPRDFVIEPIRQRNQRSLT